VLGREISVRLGRAFPLEEAPVALEKRRTCAASSCCSSIELRQREVKITRVNLVSGDAGPSRPGVGC
jgi:hypothetical protein